MYTTSLNVYICMLLTASVKFTETCEMWDPWDLNCLKLEANLNIV